MTRATGARKLPLKAYAVTLLVEGTGGVVFANCHAAARREGASEFSDGDWYSVECRRAAEFDHLERVEITDMLRHGWLVPCAWCECVLTSEDAPLIMHGAAYCGPDCHEAEGDSIQSLNRRYERAAP